MDTNRSSVIDPQKEWIILAVVLAPIIVTAWYWNDLPELLPIHWNWKGEVDGYGPKWLTPLINIGLYILLIVLPLLDPRRANYARFARAYFFIRLALVAFLGGIHLMTVFVALGYAIPVGKVVPAAVLLLLAFLGNYLTTVKPNWFVGIRTPWTLESEDIWRRTHRMAGRLWFLGGLAAIPLVFLVPSQAVIVVFMIVVAILVLVPVLYSWRLYQDRDELV